MASVAQDFFLEPFETLVFPRIHTGLCERDLIGENSVKRIFLLLHSIPAGFFSLRKL